MNVDNSAFSSYSLKKLDQLCIKFEQQWWMPPGLSREYCNWKWIVLASFHLLLVEPLEISHHTFIEIGEFSNKLLSRFSGPFSLAYFPVAARCLSEYVAYLPLVFSLVLALDWLNLQQQW